MQNIDPDREFATAKKFSSETSPSPNFLDLLKFVKKRGGKRAAITKLINTVSGKLEELSLEDKTSYIDALNKYKADLEELDESIADTFASCEEFTFQKQEELDRFNSHYNFNIIKMVKILEKCCNQQNESSRHSDVIRNPHAKIPKLQILPFDGNPAQFMNFKTSFRNIFDKLGLSNQEAFTYLKQHLKGNPAIQIGSIQESDTAYDEAWIQLEQCYASPGQIKFALIKNFLSCKTAKKDYKSLHDFQAEMRASINSLKSQNVTLEDVQLYVYYHKLDSNLQEYLRTCGFKLYNSFDNFQEAIIEATKTLCDNESKSSKLNLSSLLAEGGYPNRSEKRSSYENKNNELPMHFMNLATTSKSSPASQSPYLCKLCNSNKHSISRCDRYLKSKDKLQRLGELGYCTRCSSHSHTNNNCKIKLDPCFHCKYTNHLSFLCSRMTYAKGRDYSKSEEKGRSVKDSKESVMMCNFALIRDESAILPSLMLPISNSDQELICKKRCLIDTCSQNNYVTKSLVTEFNLQTKMIHKTLAITGFNSTVTKPYYEVCLFNIASTTGFKPIQAIVLDQIPVSFEIKGLTDLVVKLQDMGHKLADAYNSNEVSNFDILLGASNIKDLEVCPYRLNEAEAFSSAYGLILKGYVSDYLTSPVKTSVSLILEDVPTPCNFDKLSKDIGNFSSLENLGVADDSLISNAEQQVVDDFQSDVRLENGRMSVKVPWNDNKDRLTPNFHYAYGRLQSTIRKLSKTKLLPSYEDIFRQQLESGIIKEIPLTNDMIQNGYFLPHFAVIRPDVSTTKVRIVVDPAGKKTPNDISLNEAVLDCPSLLPHLAKLIIKIRHGQYLTICDIEKAFLQINLRDEEDKHLHKLLWLEDASKPLSRDNLKCLSYNRVTFGNKSSPFLLQETLKHILESQDTSMGFYLSGRSYMDNFLINTENFDQIKETYSLAIHYLKHYGFRLYEWASNCPQAERFFCDEGINSSEDPKLTKLLGYIWDRKADVLGIKSFELKPNLKTKREILSNIQSLFDPIGFVAPISFKLKIFMQKVNSYKNWDEDIELSLCKEWKLMSKDINKIKHLEFPRVVYTELSPSYDKCKMHIFCDASKMGYGVACYLCDGVSSNLIYAKSRINPSGKGYSICKLELLAIFLGVNIARYLYDAYTEGDSNKCFFDTVIWTDSLVAASWIAQRTLKMQSIFIKNRVQEIQASASAFPFNNQFRHVSGIDNPADLLTRGISVKMFKKMQDLYLKGPSFLLDERMWPSTIVVDLKNGILPSTTLLSHQPVSSNVFEPIFDLERFSSRLKSIRITGYVLKFIENLKYFHSHPRKDGRVSSPKVVSIPPSGTHLKAATTYWIKTIQRKYFEQEITGLTGSQKGDITDLQKDLKLFLDQDGIIRTFGRYRYAGKLKYSARYPVLMPADCHFTRMVAVECHERTKHAGMTSTCSMIRQEFWVPKIRQMVRKVLRSCIHCKKYHAKPYSIPTVGPLIKEKQDYSYPFETTALDYAGPIIVKTDKDSIKAYILLFTCINTRFSSLQICYDLSTTTFLRELYHLSLTYAQPRKLISDNQSTFKKAHSFLYSLYHSNEVQQYCSEHNIDWQFTAAYSPRTLGVAERIVGLIKKAIYTSMKGRKIPIQDFPTVIKEIMNMINSRPLTYLTIEDGMDVLTPNKLMFGRDVIHLNFLTDLRTNQVASDEGTARDPSFKLPKEKLDERKEILKFFNQSMTQSKAIKKRWREEYLLGLREYETKQHKDAGLKRIPIIGDLCLLNEQSQLPKYFWKIGRIVDLHPDEEGTIRHVTIQTSSGHSSKRHVYNLFPLEVASNASVVHAEIPESIQNGEEVQSPSITDTEDPRPKRTAALKFKTNLQQMIVDGSI